MDTSVFWNAPFRPQGGALVVAYHYVRDTAGTPYEGMHALGTAAFAEQVTAFQATGTLVTPEWFESCVDGRTSPVNPSVLLTFDDGLADHYEHVLPVLTSLRAQAIFFVSTASNESPARVLNVQKTQILLARLGSARLMNEIEAACARAGLTQVTQTPHPVLYRYDTAVDRCVKQTLNYELPYEIADALLTGLLERHVGPEEEVARSLYLTSAMIREMSAAGMTFGFHTRDHRVLSRLSPSEQREQLAGGVAWLKSLTGQATVPFCYPHGHAHAYDATSVNLLREMGYSMAFTAVRGFAVPGRSPRFELPRFDTCDVAALFGQPAGAWH